MLLKDKVRLVTEGEIPESMSATIQEIVQPQQAKDKEAFGSYGYGGGAIYSSTGPIPIVTNVFNGEKNEGALGLPSNLLMDHQALRARAYEAEGTSDVVKIITGKFKKWVVGNGLKFQAEPDEKILSLEKANPDIKEFKSNVEPYWELWAASKCADYAQKNDLHILAQDFEETRFLGGDCLVICRIDDEEGEYDLNVQIIDGQHVVSPLPGDGFIEAAKVAGNIINKGIEKDSRGRAVAYYVRKAALDSTEVALTRIANYKVERLVAKDPDTGIQMVWLGVGKKHRIDHDRGIPQIYNILEKVTCLDRYTEATVQTAEERAKLVWTVVHGANSDGENPMIQNARKILGNVTSPDTYVEGGKVAQNMSVIENKQVYNMPVDSQLKAVSSQSEIQYEPFFKAIFIQLCAAVDIPPEVALQQYNSNYSASRAAINSWGFIIDIYRKNCARDFYQPIYEIWLYVHILKGKVKADKYLKARKDKNKYVIAAYSKAKFTGISMPHIDPVKEMTAIRLAMGAAAVNVPLISNEQATEQAQYGDWETNVKKLSGEMKLPELVELLKEDEEDNATDTETKESNS